MKDNIALLAAAVGGFLLSITIAGIINAAPVTFLKAKPNFSSTPVVDLQLKPVNLKNREKQSY